jgi:hypothetical protein
MLTALDDLPIIKDNIKKGWSTFIGKVRSKLDGEPEPPTQPQRPIDYGYGRQASRYDADPRVLSDDFSHLNVQDQSGRGAPTQSHRPLANPDLFKSTRFSNSERTTDPPPKPPRPQENTSSSNPPLQSQTQGAGGTPNKKWEPLRPAEDRDPFALGDTDEEDRDDLYGTPASRRIAPGVEKQESGVIETPLDPAVSTASGKQS